MSNVIVCAVQGGQSYRRTAYWPEKNTFLQRSLDYSYASNILQYSWTFHSCLNNNRRAKKLWSLLNHHWCFHLSTVCKVSVPAGSACAEREHHWSEVVEMWTHLHTCPWTLVWAPMPVGHTRQTFGNNVSLYMHILLSCSFFIPPCCKNFSIASAPHFVCESCKSV